MTSSNIVKPRNELKALKFALESLEHDIRSTQQKIFNINAHSPPRIPGQRGDYVPYIENIDDAVNALEYRKTQKQNLKSRMVELEQQKEAVVERIRVEEQRIKVEKLKNQKNSDVGSNQSQIQSSNQEQIIEQNQPIIPSFNSQSSSSFSASSLFDQIQSQRLQDASDRFHIDLQKQSDTQRFGLKQQQQQQQHNNQTQKNNTQIQNTSKDLSDSEDIQIQDNNQSYNNEEEDIEQSLTPMIDDINHPSISISPDQSISITPSLTPQPFEQQQQQQQNSLHTFQQQPLYYNIDTTTLPNGQKITLQIPYNIWICLLPFQQSGVRWLWGLHQDEVGGLLGDEMGLGKTIQTLAFLEALKCSGIYKPSLLLCPATVMKQWKEECKIWAPHIRPIILHTQFDSEQNREERVQQKQEKMMEKDFERERKKKKKIKEKEKKNNLDNGIKQKKNSIKKTKMNNGNEFFVSDDEEEEQEDIDIDSLDESVVSINHNLIGNEDDEDYKEEYDMDSDINNKGDNTTSEDIELNDEIMLQQKNIQENKDDYNYMKEQEQDIEDELDQMIKVKRKRSPEKTSSTKNEKKMNNNKRNNSKQSNETNQVGRGRKRRRLSKQKQDDEDDYSSSDIEMEDVKEKIIQNNNDDDEYIDNQQEKQQENEQQNKKKQKSKQVTQIKKKKKKQQQQISQQRHSFQDISQEDMLAILEALKPDYDIRPQNDQENVEVKMDNSVNNKKIENSKQMDKEKEDENLNEIGKLLEKDIVIENKHSIEDEIMNEIDGSSKIIEKNMLNKLGKKKKKKQKNYELAQLNDNAIIDMQIIEQNIMEIKEEEELMKIDVYKMDDQLKQSKPLKQNENQPEQQQQDNLNHIIIKDEFSQIDPLILSDIQYQGNDQKNEQQIYLEKEEEDGIQQGIQQIKEDQQNVKQSNIIGIQNDQENKNSIKNSDQQTQSPKIKLKLKNKTQNNLNIANMDQKQLTQNTLQSKIISKLQNKPQIPKNTSNSQIKSQMLHKNIKIAITDELKRVKQDEREQKTKIKQLQKEKRNEPIPENWRQTSNSSRTNNDINNYSFNNFGVMKFSNYNNQSNNTSNISNTSSLSLEHALLYSERNKEIQQKLRKAMNQRDKNLRKVKKVNKNKENMIKDSEQENMNEINGQDEQSTSSEDIEEYEGEKNALIITTYETVRSYPALFLPLNVQYVILDEGQRIKNPQTLISKVVRRFDTGHRIMLTGAPVQNRLEELWSLVDFAYPGRLGTLQAFKSQFGIPITLGTKGGASPHLARIAVRCALALKQLIQRVLLRRVKRRVCKELPPKREEVIFVRMTEYQHNKYIQYLNSEDVQLAVEGAKGSVNNNNNNTYSNYSSNQNDAANKWNDKRKHRSSHYTAIGMLRKICNHPDLFYFHSPEEDKPEKYLFWKKSGKMIVLKQMLTKWFESHVRYKKWIEEEQKRLLEEENERLDDYYDDGINNNNNEQGIQKDKDIIEDIQNKDNINEQEQNKENIQVNKPIKNKKNKQPPLPHKVLLFCQTRQMLGAIEEMVNLLSLPYIRMDGTTPVNKRQQLVQQFNDIKNYNEFLFLLTTKVGGIGINLTGADRVVIFDPDWNPFTDIQARERAWRLGQTRPVHIVRLISAGTIEERIYERQIFKEIVGAKVVKGADQSVDDAAEAQMTLPSNKSSSSSSSSSSSTNKIDQIKNSFIFGFGNSSKYLFQAPPPLYIQTNKKKYKEKLLRENNEQQEREINEKKDIMKGMKTRQKIVNNINQLQFDENGENQLIEIDGVQKKKIKDEENRKQLLSIAKEMKQQGILKDKQKELEQEKENDNNDNNINNELEEDQEQDEQDILSSFIVRAGTEEEEKQRLKNRQIKLLQKQELEKLKKNQLEQKKMEKDKQKEKEKVQQQQKEEGEIEDEDIIETLIDNEDEDYNTQKQQMDISKLIGEEMSEQENEQYENDLIQNKEDNGILNLNKQFKFRNKFMVKDNQVDKQNNLDDQINGQTDELNNDQDDDEELLQEILGKGKKERIFDPKHRNLALAMEDAMQNQQVNLPQQQEKEIKLNENESKMNKFKEKVENKLNKGIKQQQIKQNKPPIPTNKNSHKNQQWSNSYVDASFTRSDIYKGMSQNDNDQKKQKMNQNKGKNQKNQKSITQDMNNINYVQLSDANQQQYDEDDDYQEDKQIGDVDIDDYEQEDDEDEYEQQNNINNKKQNNTINNINKNKNKHNQSPNLNTPLILNTPNMFDYRGNRIIKQDKVHTASQIRSQSQLILQSHQHPLFSDQQSSISSSTTQFIQQNLPNKLNSDRKSKSLEDYYDEDAKKMAEEAKVKIRQSIKHQSHHELIKENALRVKKVIGSGKQGKKQGDQNKQENKQINGKEQNKGKEQNMNKEKQKEKISIANKQTSSFSLSPPPQQQLQSSVKNNQPKTNNITKQNQPKMVTLKKKISLQPNSTQTQQQLQPQTQLNSTSPPINQQMQQSINSFTQSKHLSALQQSQQFYQQQPSNIQQQQQQLPPQLLSQFPFSMHIQNQQLQHQQSLESNISHQLVSQSLLQGQSPYSLQSLDQSLNISLNVYQPLISSSQQNLKPFPSLQQLQTQPQIPSITPQSDNQQTQSLSVYPQITFPLSKPKPKVQLISSLGGRIALNKNKSRESGQNKPRK